MTTDIEREIFEIFGITPQHPSNEKRKRGRRPNAEQPTWSLDFYEPERNITYALISMCIKDDFDQTLPQLAARLAACKGRPKSECLKILKNLSECGKLGYYDDYSRIFCPWRGEF